MKRSAWWWVRVMWFAEVEVGVLGVVVIAFFDFGSFVVSESVEESWSVILAFEEDFDDFWISSL